VTEEILEIRSQLRGGHWVAWLGSPTPSSRAVAVLMVGQTKEEAETRLKEWNATAAARYLSRDQ
jgi:hypothetical protein